MKTSDAWTEQVAFVDCPECGETIELGSGLIWSEPIELECPECAETFLVNAPDES